MLDPFFCRERPGSSKKGATAASAQTFTFFLLLDPFLCRERPGTFKKGPRQLALKLASGSTFSVALPDTLAVPVLALSVPCFLLVAVALSVADPVWISFVFQNLQSMSCVTSPFVPCAAPLFLP